VQFAAGRCPKGSIYGFVRAFGPFWTSRWRLVFLRFSDHELPDMVFDLEGFVSVEVVGRIDSVNGGIRSSFEAVPDAPVSGVVVWMQGGRKKGLIVNSTNLCAGKHRATVKFIGQNGKRRTLRPVLRNSRCKKR
jgi:hypothetical protein